MLQLSRCDCDAKNQRGKPKHFCAWQRENGQPMPAYSSKMLKIKSHDESCIVMLYTILIKFARPVTASRWRLKVHHLCWGPRIGSWRSQQHEPASFQQTLHATMPYSPHIPNTRERTAGVKGPTAIIQLRFMWEDLWIPRCFTLHETKQECAGNAEHHGTPQRSANNI